MDRRLRQITAALKDVSKGLKHPEARPQTQAERDRLRQKIKQRLSIKVSGFEVKIDL